MIKNIIMYSLCVLVLSSCAAMESQSLYQEAKIRYEDGHYIEAIDVFSKSIEVDKSNEKAYIYRGISHSKNDNHQAALDDFSKAIEINPYNQFTFCQRGQHWYKSGDYDKAISDFEKAISICTHHYDAYYRLGHAWNKKGDRGKAESYFSKAIEINPTDDTYISRGQYYLTVRNIDAALRDFDKAIALNSSNDRAFCNRGTCWYKLSDYDKAIEDFEKAIGIRRKHADAYLKLGHAWRKKGDFSRARSYFLEFVDVRPCSDTYNQAAWVFATSPTPEIRDSKKAIELAKKASKSATLAAAYASDGQFQQAIELQEAAIIIAKSSNKTAELEKLNNRLSLYKEGKPYIERDDSNTWIED